MGSLWTTRYRRGLCFVLGYSVILFSFALVHAQSFNGLLANSRASSGSSGLGSNGWATVGVLGGIPTTYTQCTNTACATVAATWPSTTGAQINAAIAGAPSNTYVLLPSGTDHITDTGIVFLRNNVILRGGGANSTFLIFSAGVYNSCGGGYHTAICSNGSAGFYWVTDANFANWTGGLAQGSTVLTLSTVAGIVANQSIIGLDQCSLGNSGYPCSTNAETDNGNYFDCDILWAAGSGCAVNGPDGGNQRLNRPQNELYQVSAVNAGANQVTLIGSIRAPNWNAAETPAVYVASNPIQYIGVENLSIDVSANSSSNGVDGVVLLYTANSWVHGVRVVEPGYAGLFCVLCVHSTFEQNYIFSTNHLGSGADIFGMNSAPSSDNLFQANICQWDETCFGNEGADTGSVIAYNFFINDYDGNGGLFPSNFPHAGDRYQLFEGNAENSYFGENFHGPKLMNTLFRNFITGWESCANSSVCGSATYKGGGGDATTPVRMVAYSRYHNIIANVLGTPGIATGYSSTAGFVDNEVYEIGSDNGSIPVDPVVASTLFRWGNWDPVTNAIRWCGNSSDTGWVANCSSTSEVPTGFSPYGQPLPTVGDTGAGMSALPASLYLASKPYWFGAIPFPPIGPDVSSGNVGQCTGTFGPSTGNVAGQFGGVAATSSGQCTGTLLAAAWGGHVNANPAMACFLAMGGPVDGSNTSALNFDASTCYGFSTGGASVGASFETIPIATASRTAAQGQVLVCHP